MVSLTVMAASLLVSSMALGQALPPSDCTLDKPDKLTCRLSSINSQLE